MIKSVGEMSNCSSTITVLFNRFLLFFKILIVFFLKFISLGLMLRNSLKY